MFSRESRGRKAATGRSRPGLLRGIFIDTVGLGGEFCPQEAGRLLCYTNFNTDWADLAINAVTKNFIIIFSSL